MSLQPSHKGLDQVGLRAQKIFTARGLSAARLFGAVGLISQLLLFGLPVAEAQTAQAGHRRSAVGLVLGMSVADVSNTNPRQLSGLQGSTLISESISLGGYYLLPGSVHGEGHRRFDYSLHGIQLAYHMRNDTGDTSLALRTGMTKIRTEVEGSSQVIFSPYHTGLSLGYDHYLWSWLTVGFEGSVVRFANSQTTLGESEYREGQFTLINFMLALKLRF